MLAAKTSPCHTSLQAFRLSTTKIMLTQVGFEPRTLHTHITMKRQICTGSIILHCIFAGLGFDSTRNVQYYKASNFPSNHVGPGSIETKLTLASKKNRTCQDSNLESSDP